MKKFTLSILVFSFCIHSFANNDKDSLKAAMEIYLRHVDSVEKSMHYQTGKVSIKNGLAELDLPSGFKFLGEDQSKYVIEKVWGNMPQENIVGMLFPIGDTPYTDSSYAFILRYEEVGFVKEDDAEKINYEELPENMQKDEAKENQ